MAVVWHIPGAMGVVITDAEDEYLLPGYYGSIKETQAAVAPGGPALPLVPYQHPLPTQLRM